MSRPYPKYMRKARKAPFYSNAVTKFTPRICVTWERLIFVTSIGKPSIINALSLGWRLWLPNFIFINTWNPQPFSIRQLCLNLYLVPSFPGIIAECIDVWRQCVWGCQIKVVWTRIKLFVACRRCPCAVNRITVRIMNVAPIGVTVRQGNARARRELKCVRVELCLLVNSWLIFHVQGTSGWYCVGVVFTHSMTYVGFRSR